MDFEKIADKVASSTMGRFRVPGSTPARRAKGTEKALAILEDGYQNKKIWNVDFKESRDFLNRAVEGAGNAFNADFLSYWKEQRELHGEQVWTDAVSGVYYGSPSGLHQLGSFAKKLAKYNGFLKKEMEDFVEEWTPIAKAFKDLKPFIEKGRKPDPNAKPKDVYLAPRTSTKGLAMIREALNKVVAHEADSLVEQVAEGYMTSAKRFLDERKPEEDVYRFFKQDPVNRGIVGRMVVMTSGRADFGKNPKTFEMSGGAESVAKKAAQAVVKEVVERYLYKNQNKIGSVVDRKGGLEKIKVSYGRLQGWGFAGEMICIFSDGTQFTVRNKVVYKYSYRGNDYAQYPTTFHRVKFPDGKTKAMVPEKAMNEEWAKA